MSDGRRSITPMIVPLSLDGTPAAGSSSSSTLGDEAERYGNLDQPLAAIGERVDRTQCLVCEPQPFEQREGFLDRRAMTTGRTEQSAADPLPLADRQGDVFEDAQAAEQRGDLEGADEPALDPRGLRQMRDFGAVEMDLPGVRLQRASHQLDKSRLAGAVRPDQGVPGAALQAKIHPLATVSAPKLLCSPQVSSAAPTHSRGTVEDAEARRRGQRPRHSTINSPIQKYQ